MMASATNFFGEFVANGSLGAFSARADRAVDFGEDEVDGLVGLFEEGALEDLVGRGGARDLGAVEMHAPDFRAGAVVLRVLAEKKYGGLGGTSIEEQVQVGHDVLDRGRRREGEFPLPTSAADESGYRFPIQILQAGSRTRLFFKRAILDEPMGDEVVRKALANSTGELWKVREAPADELASGLSDKGQHLRMAGFVVGALDVDKAGFTGGCGRVELAFGWGKPLGILRAVFVTQEADVDRGPLHFVEIDLVSATIRGGQVFKEEDLEETAEQSVAKDVILEGAAFGGQFLLDRANENARLMMHELRAQLAECGSG